VGAFALVVVVGAAADLLLDAAAPVRVDSAIRPCPSDHSDDGVCGVLAQTRYCSVVSVATGVEDEIENLFLLHKFDSMSVADQRQAILLLCVLDGTKKGLIDLIDACVLTRMASSYLERRSL
jgi:hypothetical protein